MVTARRVRILFVSVPLGLAAAGASADTWRPTTSQGAPTERYSHRAVWTGSTMIVWGGVNSSSPAMNSGGVYDPSTDEWRATAASGAPSIRSWHSTVWTGSKVIVWGGYSFDPLSGKTTFHATGGLYDPATNTWAPTSDIGAPSPRCGHTAVWTGTKMIVWGGFGSVNSGDTGGVYDPATDSWANVSTTNAPTSRGDHTAVWTGTRMIVWGGLEGFFSYLSTGGAYDPATDTWSPTSTVAAPIGRTNHTAVWTGSRMIVWGGAAATKTDTGGVYDPSVDAWTAVSTVEAPSPRSYHTAVWTGARMIIWGGREQGERLASTGGVYDPVSASWAATTALGAPTARSLHTAVWTGSRMIVWGGEDQAGSTRVGAVYDPTGDYRTLLWHHQGTGDLYTWFMAGPVAAAGSYLTPRGLADPRWQVRAIADFDGDAQPDLLWRNLETGELYVWFMAGTAVRSGSYLSPSRLDDPDWEVRAAADFDGDRKTDLLWQSRSSGVLYVWFLDGAVLSSGAYLTPDRLDDPRWQIRGAGDLTGDGKPDLLWHNVSDGSLYVWQVDGTVTTGGSYLTPPVMADTNWTIAREADFDANGTPDLLWRHRTTGDLYVWFLSGTVVTGGSYLTPSRMADPAWTVAPR